MGISLDARKTAENALGVGMAGLPFGYDVTPVIDLDENVAQVFLLDNQVNLAAFNARATSGAVSSWWGCRRDGPDSGRRPDDGAAGAEA